MPSSEHTVSAASRDQPPANTAEPAEQPPLRLAQQRVAPVERALQRPLPGGERAAAAGQEPEGVGEPSRRSALLPAPPSSPPQALWPAVCLRVACRLSATAPAFSGVSAKAEGPVERPLHEQPRRPSSASSSSTVAGRPGSGRERDGTVQLTSPVMPRASRLVARTRRSGHERRRSSTSRATASTRCSQLSSTSNICLDRKDVDQRVEERFPRTLWHLQGPRPPPELPAPARRAARARPATPRPGKRRPGRRPPPAPGASCPSRPVPVSVRSRVMASARLTSSELALATHETGHRGGQVMGSRSERLLRHRDGGPDRPTSASDYVFAEPPDLRSWLRVQLPPEYLFESFVLRQGISPPVGDGVETHQGGVRPFVGRLLSHDALECLGSRGCILRALRRAWPVR